MYPKYAATLNSFCFLSGTHLHRYYPGTSLHWHHKWVPDCRLEFLNSQLIKCFSNSLIAVPGREVASLPIKVSDLIAHWWIPWSAWNSGHRPRGFQRSLRPARPGRAGCPEMWWLITNKSFDYNIVDLYVDVLYKLSIYNLFQQHIKSDMEIF